MDPKELYALWQRSATDDPDLIAELKDLKEDSEIEDRFYRELEFGTGGLRGVIGAGTNRMNVYTVRKATQGLANFLKQSKLPQKVAISYDSRIKSSLFAHEAARVLAGNGIEAWIYPRLEPTPALSWAVRYLVCGAGICVTASHNPAKYNGYKVYGPDGCQITLEMADRILSEISQVDCFTGVALAAPEDAHIHAIPETCLDAFVDAVYALHGSEAPSPDFKVVYTPLNGTGLECVTRILSKIGVKHVTVVPEQEKPDGNFPTCSYPNPEIREAMQKGLELCDQVHPDLLLGTDPDCDRMGTAVPDGKGGYRLISGNEMGILLLDYICKTRLAAGTMPASPVVVSTIVSTDMAVPVCKKYGAELRRTLTGFKFIGEQIGLLEAAAEKDRYIFGFEESYGYLSGAHVRDKDAVNASMLACEAAAYYQKRGMTLLNAVEALYKEFGYYQNGLCSYAFEGEAGMRKIQSLMDQLRTAAPQQIAGLAVESVKDYEDAAATGLPSANVLEFHLEKGAKFMVRPSGTEPKIKVYLSTVADSEAAAQKLCAELKAAADEMMQ
jgi:phosphoglucomutase